MSNQLMELEQTLKNQLILVEEMRSMKDDVSDMKVEMDQKFEQTSTLLKKVSDSITVNEAECLALQSIVGKKASAFTRIYFIDSERYSYNLEMAKHGQFQRVLWSRLKHHFGVRKYVLIRRVDFDKAVAFLETISFSDLTAKEIRMTPKQLEIIELEKGNKEHE